MNSKTSPGELMASNFITPITENELQDINLDEKEVTVIFVMDSIKEDNYAEAHVKIGLQNKRREKEKNIHEIENQNHKSSQKTEKSYFCDSLDLTPNHKFPVSKELTIFL